MAGPHTNIIDTHKNTILEVTYVPAKIDSLHQLVPEREDKKPDTLYLYFVVITGILTWMVGGASLVWTSPAIMKFKSNDASINPLGRLITTIEISMLVGIPMLLAIIGTLFLPKFTDSIGRKKSLHSLCLLMFLSIIGAAFSKKIEIIIAFITFDTMIFYAISGILPIYLTEICEDHNRAKFGCLMSLCIPFGQLYSYIIGSAFSFKIFTILTAAPAIPFLALFFFAPESPVFLLAKEKKSECFRTLKKLRHNKSNTQLEADLEKIERTLLVTKNKNGIDIFKLLNTKEGRVGVMLALLLLMVQYTCGATVLMPLMAPIFNESGSNFSGNTIAIFVGAVKVSTYTITSLIIEKTGRKPLLLISCAGTSLSMSVLGTFFYLKYIDSPIVHQFQWVPLTFILIFIFTYGLGLGPIPMAIFTELFPTDLISVASAFVLTLANFLLACYTSAYPLVAEAIGTHWCLWTFGVASLIGFCLIYVLFPETKGKSIYEIQEIFKNY